MESRSVLNSEEKVWAALAHASALIPLFAPAIPSIVWFMQRKRSAYARYHALQAMSYQALAFWVWVGLIPILAVIPVLIMIPAMALTAGSSRDAEALSMLFPLAMWGLVFAVFGIYILIGLIGAAACLMGRDFRYPLIGAWLARHVGYSFGSEAAIDEEKEDHVAAAISHSTCIFLLWGIFTPLFFWITQKDRSSFLRFQTLQAAIYQGLGTLAYFLVSAVYMVSIFGMFGAALYASGLPRGSQVSPAFALAVIPMLCFMAVFVIGGPLYQLFGFIATVRTLRGHNYRYPLLGRFLERRMQSQPLAAMEAAK